MLDFFFFFFKVIYMILVKLRNEMCNPPPKPLYQSFHKMLQNLRIVNIS